MKNNKCLILLFLLFFICSGIVTYALFRTNKSGSGNINAARWNVVFKNGEEEISNNFNISLNNATWTNPLGNVASGKIAPGSQATFYITIDATNTETDVDYTVEIDESFDESDFEVTLANDVGTIAYSTENEAMIRQVPIMVVWNGNINDNDNKNSDDLLKKARDIIIPIKVTAAQKLALNYTIIFNDGLGNIISTKKVYEGEMIGELPEEPLRSGFAFVGWYDDLENGNEITTETIINQEMNIYAHWEMRNIIISFETNGGLILDNNDNLFNFDGSSRTINGTIKGATWGPDYLKFEGTSSSWVNLGQINSDNLYANVEFSIDGHQSTNQVIMGNVEQGGFEIFVDKDEKIAIASHINENYRKLSTDYSIELGKKYNVTLFYDGVVEKLFVNGEYIDELEIEGVIAPPISSTVVALGCNPQGTSCKNDFFNGKIYSASIYTNNVYYKELISNSAYGSLPIPIKKGYIFKEWNTKEDGTGITITSDYLITEIENQTLYAIYTKNKIITFDTNGGIILSNNDVLFNFDASTKTINGTIKNATWGTDYLKFNGTSSWVNLGQINPRYIYASAEFSIDAHQSTSHVILGNVEQGGFEIYVDKEEKLAIASHINGSYRKVATDYTKKKKKKYNITLLYDGKVEKLFIDGEYIGKYEIEGELGAPISSTVVALGCNPQGNKSQTDYLNGKVYSASIYTYWISEKEVITNSTYGVLPEPYKKDYTFIEWNTKDDGTGDTITSSSIVTLNEDITLYAIYIKNNN